MNKRFFQSRILSFLNKGHKRSQLAKKNILASIFIKGFNIAIGLTLVPLTINYLNPTKYGIWITLSSLISWFSFFDIGLGNGLRNKFAEAIAIGEHKLARIYVSTTYAVISLIATVLFIVFYPINTFINWNNILNTDTEVVTSSELNKLALILFAFFCLRLVFKLITTILTADQRPAKASLFDLIGQIIALVLIFILTKITEGSLVYLGLVLSASPVFVLILSSFWFYSGKYRKYRPSITFVDFSKAKILLNLGFKFFVIQVAAILLYQTNNIIITQLYGPEQVTPYNIAFKYFSVITMIFSIAVTPFWSAFTEAWVKKEIHWIENIVKKLILLWGILTLTGVLMVVLSSYVYSIWIGDKVFIPVTISFLVFLWMVTNTWNNIYSNFLNGIGKIKLQFYLGISAAIINIPLAIFLGKRLGIEGVLIANVILGFIGALIYPIQYKKLMKNKAKGIWNE